jgi:hypothetical protein
MHCSHGESLPCVWLRVWDVFMTRNLLCCVNMGDGGVYGDLAYRLCGVLCC